MSDTPRTDKIVAEFSVEEDAMVSPDFARQLERENADLADRLKSNRDIMRLIQKSLLGLQIGSCDCDAKSPETQHHAETCNFKIAKEAYELAGRFTH